jgi:hypothetical protein
MDEVFDFVNKHQNYGGKKQKPPTNGQGLFKPVRDQFLPEYSILNDLDWLPEITWIK